MNKMMVSSVHYISFGTKCVSLMTRMGPLSNCRSLCCSTYVVNRFFPANPTCFKYSSKGEISTLKRRQCLTSNVNLFAPGMCPNSFSAVSLFRTSLFFRNFSTNGKKETDQNVTDSKTPEEPVKLSLLQRFRQMYRDYWYVLVPVHLITSLGWFGGFYYLTKSGVDVVALLDDLGVSAKLVNPLRDSSAGYIAISYAIYKIATPLRYTVTLGGTTLSINYLKKWGYIKPIPPREKLKEMYNEKKATLIRETTEELKLRQEKLKKTRDNMIRGYRERTGKPEK